jgi:hypothetical protein
MVSQTSKTETLRKYASFVGTLLLLFAIMYFWMGKQIAQLGYDATNYRYAALPVTPLGELDKWAGTNQVVRLRVQLLGEPEVTTGTGENLAYKCVLRSDDAYDSRSAADWWWTPSKIKVGDGTTQVTLDLQHEALDRRYLPVRAQGTLHDHQIPPDIAVLMAPDFPEFKPNASDDIFIYTLEKGAMVTVFGVVEKEGERFMVHAPKRAFSTPLIVSPFDDARLNSQLGTGAWVMGLSIGIIILTLVFIFGLAAWSVRKARREEAQSETAPGETRPPDAWNS